MGTTKMGNKQIKINEVVLNGTGAITEIKQIALSESFMTRTKEIFNTESNISVEDLGIIKVHFENGTEQSTKGILNNGVHFNNELYVPFISSPSMMKHDTYLFIKHTHRAYTEVLEALVSGDKINAWLDNEVAINKDYTSRMALVTSNSKKVNYNLLENAIVIPEYEYNHTANYSYYGENDTEYNNLLEGELTRTHTGFDGCGIASPKFFEDMAEELNVNHKLDFIVFRTYKGIASKGVLSKFNWKQYMIDRHSHIGDTDFFKFEISTQEYMIYCAFRQQFKSLNSVECVLNQSQLKWMKNWTSYSELETEYSKDMYRPYAELLNSLYVTKYNKPNIQEFNLTNYQLLQNTNVTASELIELSKPTVDFYERILKGDLEAIKVLLNDIYTEEQLEKSADNEEVEIKNVTQSLIYLVKTMGNKAFRLNFVRTQVSKMIEKKIKELSAGKMYLKSDFKTGIGCSISYCNFAMTREVGTNGLQANEFYVANEQGVRTMSRNPIAYYGEVTNVELVENNEIAKFCGEDYSKELVMFNAKDNALFIASGADLDADLFNITDEPIIANSVVQCDRPFCNIEDGATSKLTFTRENIYNAYTKSTGNLIGSIAMINSKLNSQCRSLNWFINNSDSSIASYNDIRELYLQSQGLTLEDYKNGSDEELQAHKTIINETIERCYTKLEDTTIETQKSLINRAFENNLQSFSDILLASQIAIDKPKTLVGLSEELKAKIDRLKGLKKGIFLHYFGKCKCQGKGSVNSCGDLAYYMSKNEEGILERRAIKNSSHLDKYNSYVIRNLMIENFKLKKQSKKDEATLVFNLCQYSVTVFNYSSSLESAYKIYNKTRKSIAERFKALEVGGELSEVNKDLKVKELQALKMNLTNHLEELREKGDMDSVSVLSTIINKSISESFTTEYLFNDIARFVIPTQDNSEKFKLVLTKSDIYDFSFRGKSYVKNYNELITETMVLNIIGGSETDLELDKEVLNIITITNGVVTIEATGELVSLYNNSNVYEGKFKVETYKSSKKSRGIGYNVEMLISEV